MCVKTKVKSRLLGNPSYHDFLSQVLLLILELTDWLKFLGPASLPAGFLVLGLQSPVLTCAMCALNPLCLQSDHTATSQVCSYASVVDIAISAQFCWRNMEA